MFTDRLYCNWLPTGAYLLRLLRRPSALHPFRCLSESVRRLQQCSLMEISASGTSLAQCSARQPTGPGARCRYFNLSSELRRDGPLENATQCCGPCNHIGRVTEGRREAWKQTEAIATMFGVELEESQ